MPPPIDRPIALFQGTSHEEGRNAKVSLYLDRIERVPERSRLSVSRAKQAKEAQQDVEVIPIEAVSSVQTKKDGLRYTKVIVSASGNKVEFRFRHSEAEAFVAALQRQMPA